MNCIKCEVSAIFLFSGVTIAIQKGSNTIYIRKHHLRLRHKLLFFFQWDIFLISMKCKRDVDSLSNLGFGFAHWFMSMRSEDCEAVSSDIAIIRTYWIHASMQKLWSYTSALNIAAWQHETEIHWHAITEWSNHRRWLILVWPNESFWIREASRFPSSDQDQWTSINFMFSRSALSHS